MESLCTACSDIFVGGEARKRDSSGAIFLHHESFAAFQDTLRTGCFFCEMMEKAYVNERGHFPESVRHGTEAFKITYIFETDIEWLGHFSDDENEHEEDQEEMINDAKELQHAAQSPLDGDDGLTDGDNADTENIMEETGEAVDTFEMLVVHFWRGEHDRTVKDFWLLPTTQRQYLSSISIVPSSYFR